MVSTQVTQSQSVRFSGVALVTVGLDLETISSASRVAAQLLGASFAGNMPDYLPRNRDVELLKSLQRSEGCLCIINVDSDRELAMETAVSLQQLLGDRVLLIALSSKSNPGLILDAMRSGYAEYLRSPLNCDEFSDSLLRLRRRWAVGCAAKSGTVLSFLGARGGGRNDDPGSSSVHVPGPTVREKSPSGGSASAAGSCRPVSRPAGVGISLLRFGPQR